MNKLIIGLLVIAAGAGVFFILRNKKTGTRQTDQKESLIGKWKLDSLDVKTKDSSTWYMSSMQAFDSNFGKYHYDFRPDGNIFISLPDSAKSDTSGYEWRNNGELLIKEMPNDSTSELYLVSKLNNNNFHLIKANDSTIFYFSKLK